MIYKTMEVQIKNFALEVNLNEVNHHDLQAELNLEKRLTVFLG